MNIKFFVLGLVLVQVLGSYAYGQETEYTDEPTKERSSFVPDPDPLDPLPVTNLNLKEGDEIMLEDIKGILDEKTESSSMQDSSVEGSDTPAVVDLDPGSDESISPSVSEEVGAVDFQEDSSTSEYQSSSDTGIVDFTNESPAPAKTSSSKTSQSLISDNPDYELENKFHREYRRYHSVPTSDEIWGKVAGSQKEHQYIVQRGDTLYSISQLLFGDSQFWPKLWAMNRGLIFNPHHIKPGMILYFYAGNVDGAPVLTMEKMGGGAVVPSGAAPTKSGEVMASDDGSNPEYYSQDTEYGNRLRGDGEIPKHLLPMPIPDSLPSYSYLNVAPNESQINLDLKPIVVQAEYVVKNPYILSSQNLESSFKVASSSIDRLVCKENQFIPNMIRGQSKKLDRIPESGNYLIVLKVPAGESFLKSTYIYKKVGSVYINDSNEMRVQGCTYLYNADSLFVTQRQLDQLPPPQEHFKQAGILEGLDFQKQDFFSAHQLIILGVGGQNVEEGQIFKVHSKEESRTVGQVKIIKRTGNLAIGHISEATDIIRSGDTILQ